MRRSNRVAALAVVLGTGLWVLPSGNAGADDDSDWFRVTVREVDSAELNLGAKEFGLGDRFVFTEDLYQRGKRVGTDHGECVLTRLRGTGGTFNCNVSAVFAGKGQLTIQGAFTFTEDEGGRFVLAITGGTGRFRDAGGVVVVDETGERSTLTFKLDDD